LLKTYESILYQDPVRVSVTNENELRILHIQLTINQKQVIMKTKAIGLFGLLTIILFLGSMTGCQKEEDVNFISYDGINLNIQSGVVESWGKLIPDAEGYNVDLKLYSAGISYNSETDTWSGEGAILYFEMFSPSEGELSAGEYILDKSGSQSAYSFGRGYLVTGFCFEGTLKTSDFLKLVQNSENFFHITDGSVHVGKSKNSFSVRVQSTTDEGRELTASYHGPLSKVSKK
jgi:hypothetical protein